MKLSNLKFILNGRINPDYIGTYILYTYTSSVGTVCDL